MKLNPQLIELCEIRALQIMAAFEREAKEQGMALTEYTPIKLDTLIWYVCDGRGCYPVGAKIAFTDVGGPYHNGEPVDVEGVICDDLFIKHDETMYLPVRCHRPEWREPQRIMVLEEDIRRIETVRPDGGTCVRYF